MQRCALILPSKTILTVTRESFADCSPVLSFSWNSTAENIMPVVFLCFEKYCTQKAYLKIAFPFPSSPFLPRFKRTPGFKSGCTQY